jgi:hypothetical protein
VARDAAEAKREAPKVHRGQRAGLEEQWPISIAAPRLPHDQPNGKPNASNRRSQNLQFCHRRIKSFAMMARN